MASPVASSSGGGRCWPFSTPTSQARPSHPTHRIASAAPARRTSSRSSPGCRTSPTSRLLRKDCINGFVGGIEPIHHGAHGACRNKVVDWVTAHRLRSVVAVGICTDICVMDFVLTMLSARNHGLMPTLKDIVVLEPACATYDLPRAAAEGLGLPATSAHPQAATHHLGLYFMASRGAVIASALAEA